jgi:AcrR family transcriptional regulator
MVPRSGTVRCASATRDARREQLVDAAFAAIRRDGPGVSMQAMAAEAGVTKPILYRHFGDRGGLVAELAARFTKHLMARLRHALTQDTDPRRVLSATMNAYIQAIEEDPNVYRFLVQRALGNDHQAGRRLLDVVEQISREVAVVIGEQLRTTGADSGAAEPWAFGLVGLVHAAGDWWLATGTMPRGRLVEYLVGLVWDGLANSGLAPPSTASSVEDPVRPAPSAPTVPRGLAGPITSSAEHATTPDTFSRKDRD